MKFNTKTTYKKQITITGYDVIKKTRIKDGESITSFDIHVLLDEKGIPTKTGLTVEPTITEEYLKKFVLEYFKYSEGKDIVEDLPDDSPNTFFTKFGLI